MRLFARTICTFALAAASLTPALALADAKFIYLTRHAEKSATGADPVLTPEGRVRAQNIAATLKKAGITRIFSTNYARTRETAQALAAVIPIPVQIYDGSQIAVFAQQLKDTPGNALVVGHSDTTPELIRQLGGESGITIAETEFDRLYQVAIGADGDVSTTLLHSMPSAGTAPCLPVPLNRTGLTAAKDAWLHFTITVPECANTFNVNLSGTTGDGDLYVRFGAQPTLTDYKCRPFKSGSAESCAIADPQAGVWHISVRAFAAFSGVTLDAVAKP